MKILHVNKFYYNRGGAETAYFALTALLERHGHEVIPFAMQDERNEPTPYGSYFVSNVDLRDDSGSLRDRMAVAARILYSREAERKIDRLLRDTRPNIAHLHNVHHQLSPSILRALRRHGVPVVMTLHDYKVICPAYTLYTQGAVCERCRGHRYYNAVLRSCVKGSRLKSAVCAAEAFAHTAARSLRSVDAFIAPSRFMAQKVVQFGIDPRRVRLVPNFIDAPTQLAPDEPGRYVLYAGRLERVKGVATLLRAVAASGPARGVDVLIAGDGEERVSLEAQARELGLANVRFVGHLSRRQMEEALAAAIFVVVPSEWYENAPLSVLEAAAAGKAAIVSEIGGLPELVWRGETGLTFPAGNAGALAAAIEELLREPERAREMGHKARAFIREEFSPEAHYRGLMDVYQQALAGSDSAAVLHPEVAP